MPQYIAFLRAINVGGRVVKMDHLRTIFEDFGLSGVETFIASGNVIFQSPAKSRAALEKKIEGHLEKALGYQVGVFLRTASDLRAIVDYVKSSVNLLDTDTLHVTFLRDVPPPETAARFPELNTAVDKLHIHGSELYWICHVKFNESLVKWSAMGKAYEPGTARNIKTVRRLLDKYPPR